MRTAVWLGAGIIVGLMMGWLDVQLRAWQRRQKHRAIVERRLAELNDGRKNQDLTVRIDPVT